MTSPETAAAAGGGARRFAQRIHRFSEVTGSLIAWLTLPMVIATFAIALLRYAFSQNWIWMQELVVWMHAVVFMLAAAYTLNADEHVRVDIFYRQFSGYRKAWVNLLGTLVFLLPVSAMLIFTSFDYVVTSWSIGEGSRESGGLPFPFVPALKTVIPLAFVLVAIQGVAIALDAYAVLRRGPGAAELGGAGAEQPPVHGDGV
jgi:TRAP-type mannitol/chloroaromatic compound transport system permease small subunit